MLLLALFPWSFLDERVFLAGLLPVTDLRWGDCESALLRQLLRALMHASFKHCHSNLVPNLADTTPGAICIAVV